MKFNDQECEDISALEIRPGDLVLVTKWEHCHDPPMDVLLAEYQSGSGVGFHARDIRCLHSSRDETLPPRVDRSMYAQEYFFDAVNGGSAGYRINCNIKDCYTQDNILRVLEKIPGMKVHLPGLKAILEKRLNVVAVNA
jgi:hypothetical protein